MKTLKAFFDLDTALANAGIDSDITIQMEQADREKLIDAFKREARFLPSDPRWTDIRIHAPHRTFTITEKEP